MQSNSMIVICLFAERNIKERWSIILLPLLNGEKQIILYVVGFSAWQEFWLEHAFS